MKPVKTFVIREARFTYRYQTVDIDHAIWRWLRDTFVNGCTATTPDANGRFSVLCPAGSNAPALIVPAVISEE
jgi:hypothetical protein